MTSAEVPSSIRLDTDAWPRVVVHVLRSPTNAELRLFMDIWVDTLDEHDAPFVALIDVRAVDRFSAVQRKLVMDAMLQRSESGKGYVGGAGLVLASEFMRALMNVMVQAVPTSYPVRAFDDLESAIVWADRLIAERPSLRPPSRANG